MPDNISSRKTQLCAATRMPWSIRSRLDLEVYPDRAPDAQCQLDSIAPGGSAARTALGGKFAQPGQSARHGERLIGKRSLDLGERLGAWILSERRNRGASRLCGRVGDQA